MAHRKQNEPRASAGAIITVVLLSVLLMLLLRPQHDVKSAKVLSAIPQHTLRGDYVDVTVKNKAYHTQHLYVNPKDKPLVDTDVMVDYYGGSAGFINMTQ